MSTPKPITDRKLHGKKPDYKIRPGFTEDELAEYLEHSSVDRHFARRALVQAMGMDFSDEKDGER